MLHIKISVKIASVLPRKKHTMKKIAQDGGDMQGRLKRSTDSCTTLLLPDILIACGISILWNVPTAEQPF